MACKFFGHNKISSINLQTTPPSATRANDPIVILPKVTSSCDLDKDAATVRNSWLSVCFPGKPALVGSGEESPTLSLHKALPTHRPILYHASFVPDQTLGTCSGEKRWLVFFTGSFANQKNFCGSGIEPGWPGST